MAFSWTRAHLEEPTWLAQFEGFWLALAIALRKSALARRLHATMFLASAPVESMRRALSSRALGIAFAAAVGACGAKVNNVQLDTGGSSSIEASSGISAVATGGAAGAGGAGSFMSGGTHTIVATGGAHTIVATGGAHTIVATGGAHTAGAGGTSSVVPSNMGGIGGLPLSGYCAGTSTKVQIQGKDLSPQVTYYQPNVVLNCCNVYGLNLATNATLGFDLHLEITVPLSGVPSYYNICYTNNSACPQANLISTNESPPAPVPTVGTIRLDSDPTGAQTYAFGVCVEVDDTSSNLLGTKVFIPSPTGGQYY